MEAAQTLAYLLSGLRRTGRQIGQALVRGRDVPLLFNDGGTVTITQ